MNEFFDHDYYESGPQSGKSLYQNYRWIPELTLPLAHHIARYMDIETGKTVMDFGCAKGYVVKAFRLLGYEAYGIDVSEYAISQVDKEVEDFCKLVEPGSDEYKYTDFMIAKDVLEHIPYDSLDQTLEIMRSKCENIFAVIPLGKNGKYIIPAYELDKSHFIRESKQWWEKKFVDAGFKSCTFTTDLGPFKANWQEIETEGNLLVYGQ